MTSVRTQQMLLAGVVLAAATALWVIAHRTPDHFYLYPVCPFHALTHLYCPGCGSSRAIESLLRLDLLGAIQCNLLLVVSLPVIGHAMLSSTMQALGRRGLQPILLNRTTGRAVVFLVIAFWLLRNVPVYPFTLLAP